jgi:hypothetical protein
MQAEKYSAKWWVAVVVHNCIVHPLLPIGEVLDVLPSRRAKRIAALIFKAHDSSFPEGAG